MAEKEAYEQVTRASAALRVAQNRAETLKLQAAAEKVSAGTRRRAHPPRAKLAPRSWPRRSSSRSASTRR
jgi:hypothetical protein